MKKKIPLLLVNCFNLFLAGTALALDGQIGIHDPSTVVQCDGKYYVFGTGRGLSFLVSSNGFNWRRGGRVFDKIPDSVKSFVPKDDGSGVWAPDVIRVGNRYFVYYAVSSWGSFVSAIGLMSSPTLDTNLPDYKWTDGGMVVHSSEGEALNAIDPGVCLGPDGTLRLCYGSYHGNIELVELDPQTGRRAANSQVTIIANQSEAADIIYHGGFFYLFVNHGSCCQGTNSSYNIRVGRAQKITGPYLDDYGEDLLGGGGRLFLAAEGNDIGPGHFGLLLDDGVEKFSCHYEGVIGRPGRSILDIRPLLWTLDGWPAAGENIRDGVYQIRSRRTGANFEARTATNQTTRVLDTARYLVREYQKWAIAPAGNGFYKILCSQDQNALTTADAALQISPFAGADDQLWKLDQLADGSYRIAGNVDRLALTGVPKKSLENDVSMEKFNGDDVQHWIIAAP